jgi:HEAT repeat protein
MMKEAFSASTGQRKLVYAKVLGFLGQTEAVPTLVQALDGVAQWDAKILQGVAAEYAHLPTPIDALVLALGHSGDRRSVPSLIRMLGLLDADTTLSHHRAMAVALERLADPSAAGPLARLLQQPGMRGHAMRQLEPLSSDRDKRRREGALREIVLARALYRCGDFNGLGAGRSTSRSR